MNIRRTEHPLLNGEYWIDPEGNGNPMKVYCDMTTHGGIRELNLILYPALFFLCFFIYIMATCYLRSFGKRTYSPLQY